MVTISIHHERLTDRATHVNKLGEGFASKRGAHLDRLGGLEELVRSKSPLAISYDVNRSQPPFFHEFTYTELMGGLLYVAPQSCEVAARVMAYAVTKPADDRFDVVSSIVLQDKYQLQTVEASPHKRVVFLPGTNIFAQCVSKETLEREMQRHPDMVLKPHPLTHEDTLRQLGIAFGYECILAKDESASPYLSGAEVVYSPASSEMGLYATLLDKKVVNLTQAGFEARAVYNPIYRLLWVADDPKATLSHLLNSPFSGVFHPDDPNVSEKIDAFFKLALELREPFRPLVKEYEPAAYAALVSQQLQRPPPK